MIQTLKFYNSLKTHISNLTKNIYTKEMRIMNFFADVPQLMKTVRNFLFHSGYGCNTCGTRVFFFYGQIYQVFARRVWKAVYTY